MTPHIKPVVSKLYQYAKRKNHSFMVENKHLVNWFECDFISITTSDYLIEYEIKLNIQDFKKDFSHKVIKHLWLEGKREETILFESDQYPQNYTKDMIRQTKTPNYDGFQIDIDMKAYKGPNYFIYVTPLNMIIPQDLPPYAGLIQFDPSKRYNLSYITKPPLLHKNKTTDEMKHNIYQKYMYYYWNNNLS